VAFKERASSQPHPSQSAIPRLQDRHLLAQRGEGAIRQAQDAPFGFAQGR
jgi:hypothetical protein